MGRLPFVVSINLLLLVAGVGIANDQWEFDRDIRPILKTHCSHCHGEEPELAGALDVRLRRSLVTGGDSGPAVVVGKSAASLLIQRIESGEMPPPEASKRPTQEEIQKLRAWIDGGAVVSRSEPASLPLGPWVSPAELAFWSFQPIRRPSLPPLQNPETARTPVDCFVLAKLESLKRTLAADAKREVWLRRVCFDLTGLAPTREQQATYLADTRPGADERLVDRLLSSPAFGERWGRHWLDVAGYSDSEGGVGDPRRSDAWKYRDYVINAFNSGMPYDRFLKEQIAGDEMVSPPYAELNQQDAAKLIATGLLRMAPDATAAANNVQSQNQVVADTMEILGSAVLGMTVQCAQCHNHRYDPISQQDYYQLRAVFDPAFFAPSWKTPPRRKVSLYSQSQREQADEIEKQAKKLDAARAKRQAEHIARVLNSELEKLDNTVRAEVQAALDVPAKKRNAGQKKLLARHPSVNVTAGSLYLYDRKAADELKAMAKKAADLRATKPKQEFIRAFVEPAAKSKVAPSHLLIRGDPEQRGDVVEPRGLAILGAPVVATNDPAIASSGRRTRYAEWLVSHEHPLTARVAVNRIWLHLFGQGLVATPADFGQLGRRPSHPLLLDYLASELRDGAWQLKPVIRQIVLSRVYRQSSSAESLPGDGENRLLSRMPLRRMDAETLRDAMLQAAGIMNRHANGPAVPVMADRVGQIVIGKENLNAGRPGAVLPMNGQEYRRSVYVESRRSRPLGVLETFDLPAMTPNCERRDSSTVAPQSLMLMNGEFAVRVAARFAKTVQAEAGDDARSQASLLWHRAYNVAPTPSQTDRLTGRINQLRTAIANEEGKKADARQQALAIVCQALLSSNRFLYID